MGRVDVTVQQADGDGLDIMFFELGDDCLQLFLVDGRFNAAVKEQALV